MTTKIDYPSVVPYSEWLGARKSLLDEEKQLTRARDELNAASMRLSGAMALEGSFERAASFEGSRRARRRVAFLPILRAGGSVRISVRLERAGRRRPRRNAAAGRLRSEHG